jgi:hypothetical protein
VLSSDPRNEPLSEPQRRTLNGWKEIAAHLGKGVRTAQRWEKDLGLPVQRIGTGRAEIVTAYAEEIDEWRRQVASRKSASGEVADGADDGSDADGAARELRGGGWLRLPGTPALAAVLAGAAVLVFAAAWMLGPHGHGGNGAEIAGGAAAASDSPTPASWKITSNSLRVYDAEDRLLWEHRFPKMVSTAAYEEWPIARRHAVIEDLDGDGTLEVVFPLVSVKAAYHALYCFNSDGSIRFVSRPENTLQFGEYLVEPPLVPMQPVVTRTRDGEASIWAPHAHAFFPSLLQKLSPQGDVLAEYWSNGHITALTAIERDGRQLMLVGAANNETGGASLAVLDYDNPSGSAPAANRKYVCQECPAGVPETFLIFPRLDISAKAESHAGISGFVPAASGRTLVLVHHGAATVGEARRAATTIYTLDADHRIVAAEVVANYKVLHNELHRAGFLDRPFGPEVEAMLFPVLRWNGSGYTAITGPEH